MDAANGSALTNCVLLSKDDGGAGNANIAGLPPAPSATLLALPVPVAQKFIKQIFRAFLKIALQA